MNETIRAPKVRVIDETGKNLDVMDTLKAIKLAKEKGLDLIQITDKADPPVARIIEYGKFMYQKEKKAKEAKSKQNVYDVIKGVRITIRTGQHDLEIKAQAVDKFLKKGYKVKVELVARGRERWLKDIINAKLNSFLEMIQEPHITEHEPKSSPRGVYVVIKRR